MLLLIDTAPRRRRQQQAHTCTDAVYVKSCILTVSSRLPTPHHSRRGRRGQWVMPREIALSTPQDDIASEKTDCGDDVSLCGVHLSELAAGGAGDGG